MSEKPPCKLADGRPSPEYQRRYRESNKEKLAEYQRRHRKTEKGKATVDRYNKSEKHKESLKKYRLSPKFKVTRASNEGGDNYARRILADIDRIAEFVDETRIDSDWDT